jgi:L-2-hydroxyglutarate oxidase LhgO
MAKVLNLPPLSGIQDAQTRSVLQAIYAWMQARGFAHRKTGKLIVATSDAQISKMEALHAQGTRNGVEGLSFLSGAEAAFRARLAAERGEK